MSRVLASICLTLTIHNTEDAGILIQSIEKTLGIDKRVLELQELEGHHGNPILKYNATLSGHVANDIAMLILRKLIPHEIDHVKRGLGPPTHGTLYIRLDKSSLVGGLIRLGQSNSLQLAFRLAGMTRNMDGNEVFEHLVGSR